MKIVQMEIFKIIPNLKKILKLISIVKIINKCNLYKMLITMAFVIK